MNQDFRLLLSTNLTFFLEYSMSFLLGGSWLDSVSAHMTSLDSEFLCNGSNWILYYLVLIAKSMHFSMDYIV